MLAAAAWAALELARGRLLTGSSLFVGNPWALIAYSQVGSDALVQIAAVTGVYGISFCIVAVNAAVAEVGFAAIMSAGTKNAIAMPLDRAEAAEFFADA